VLVRALHLARGGASRDGARQTSLTDVDALIELGRVIFRVVLGDASALSVGVLGLLGARGHGKCYRDQYTAMAKGHVGAHGGPRVSQRAKGITGPLTGGRCKPMGPL
jgi:hypothetical protein